MRDQDLSSLWCWCMCCAMNHMWGQRLTSKELCWGEKRARMLICSKLYGNPSGICLCVSVFFSTPVHLIFITQSGGCSAGYQSYQKYQSGFLICIHSFKHTATLLPQIKLQQACCKQELRCFKKHNIYHTAHWLSLVVWISFSSESCRDQSACGADRLLQ